jgi:hypothetical protein
LGLAASLGGSRWLSPWLTLAGALLAEFGPAKVAGPAQRWIALGTSLCVALVLFSVRLPSLAWGLTLAALAHRGRPVLPGTQQGGWLWQTVALVAAAITLAGAARLRWPAWTFAAFALYHAYAVWLRTWLSREVRTELMIYAEPEKVWEALADVAAYPQWNPLVLHVIGEPTLGHRLAIQVQLPGRPPMSFRPRVTAYAPGHELEWLGSAGLPGLFDGRHRFAVERAENGTRFAHSEHFSGFLVPFLFDRKKITEGFKGMNEALKKRVEVVGAPI